MKSWRPAIFLAATLLLLLSAAPTQAQLAKSFAVLPFEVHGPDKYQYLKHAIQPMLVTRLTWPGHFTPVADNKLAGVPYPASDTEAIRSLVSIGADYLIYGSTTIVGDDASLDVQVRGADGQSWPMNESCKIDDLIPKLEQIAKNINDKVFAKPTSQVAEQTPTGQNKVKMLNPELVYNQADASQDFYLNPRFKYQGSPDTPGRWRSQSLKYPAISMAVTDADGDGTTEVFLLQETSLNVYRYKDRKLDEVATYEFPPRLQMIYLCHMDENGDGRQEIIASGWTGKGTWGSYNKGPWSVILNFVGDKFVELESRVPYFLNAVPMPPNYDPVLLGMDSGATKIFRNKVHVVDRATGVSRLARRLDLPEFSNVYNFAYYPEKDGSYKYLQVDGTDHIKVYNNKMDMLYETGDTYAASTVGIEAEVAPPGLGLRSKQDENETLIYYVPNRILVTKLGGDSRQEIIVNRNISVAAEFFGRYRNFPYGEVHSLGWDGVGLSLIWKTRRLKGAVVDYGLGDVDNDGMDELCICVNTYRGMTGLDSSRAVVYAYDLDMSTDDSNVVPAADDDFYKEEN